jgi:hypothetical protein
MLGKLTDNFLSLFCQKPAKTTSGYLPHSQMYGMRVAGMPPWHRRRRVMVFVKLISRGFILLLTGATLVLIAAPIFAP